MYLTHSDIKFDANKQVIKYKSMRLIMLYYIHYHIYNVVTLIVLRGSIM